MGPKTKKLVQVLLELEALLEEQEELLWKDWMAEARRRLIASDYSGVEKLLGAYGGMGSFNDLIVGYNQSEGITLQRKGHGQANQKLNLLRGQAWELATVIKREYISANI